MNTNTEKTIRVAIYARLSNKTQELGRKLAMCSEYTEHIPNHIIVTKYIDIDKASRNIADRSIFQQMLRDAEVGAFNLIVVYEMTEFSRKMSEVIHYVQRFENMGISLCFIRDNIRTGDHDSEFRLRLLTELQQDESRRQSERVKFGQECSRAKGTIFGIGNVLGYDKVDGNYVINFHQAEIVRMIFSLCIDGVGIRKICNNLEENGKLTSTGKSVWRPTTVARILKNPVYCGKIFYPRSNEIVDGTHEPIITLEDFERAQKILKERSKNYGK